MKKRLHLFIVIGVLLAGFIAGSFLDFEIDQALFDKNNGFGLFMASFGVYPCYAGLAFIGGGILCTTIRRRKELPIWVQVICYALSAAAYGMSIYLCGREWPSVNGYNTPEMAPLSYAICAVLFGGAFCGGYLISRKGDTKKLWNILIIMAIIFVVGLVPAGYLIKKIIHRPRFRLYMEDAEIPFCNWWKSFKSYKDFLKSKPEFYPDGFHLTKEEFKSFPSGHAGTGIIMAMFLPFMRFFFPKLKGKETLLFYGGVAFGLVMMFSRLLVGAHYLSDVCMGALIVMLAYYGANEFAIRKGFYDDEEEPKKEEEAPALE